MTYSFSFSAALNSHFFYGKTSIDESLEISTEDDSDIFLLLTTLFASGFFFSSDFYGGFVLGMAGVLGLSLCFL